MLHIMCVNVFFLIYSNMYCNCAIGCLVVFALFLVYTIYNMPAEPLIANRFKPGETLNPTDVANSDISMRLLQYHDYMRSLEFAAQQQIAGCNSPPPVMMLLYGIQ